MKLECVVSSQRSIFSGEAKSQNIEMVELRSKMLSHEQEEDPPASCHNESCDSSEIFSTRPSCTPDLGDAIVQELLPLEGGLQSLSPGYLWGVYRKLVLPSLYLGLSNYGYDLLNMFGFYMANRSGDIEVQSSFGLMIFFNTVLIFGFFYSIDEKVGLGTSIALGAKDYQKAKRTFWQGMLTVALLAGGYFFPLVMYSEGLFAAIGIDLGNARLCSLYLKKLFPVDLFRMFNEIMFTFTLAQGVQFNYGLFAILNMIASLLAGLVAANWFDMGMDSWLVCRIVHEILIFAMVVYPFLYKVEARTKGLLSLTETLQEYGQFLQDCTKYTVSLYSEWIGCEVAIYFTGLTHDQAQITAHTSMANISYFIMNTGLGFSTVGRTRINVLLGKGHQQAAKNFFLIFLTGMAATGLVMSQALLFFRQQVANFYGESPEVNSILYSLLGIYAACLPADFIFPFLFTVCRSTNQILLSVLLNVCFLIVYCTGADYYLIMVRHLTCKELVGNMYLAIYTIFALLIARLVRLDWKRLRINIEELEID